MPAPRKYENPVSKHAAYRKRQAEARRLELSRKGLPALPVIPTMPGNSRWTKMLEEAGILFRTVLDERETYHDERSEAWQESDKAEVFVETTEAIRAIVEGIEDLD
jgi:hypothetical protein